ncbi:MAG TPA: hypothetical protein VHN18_12415, partial [Micromonosporaceae bacterium]|nr:hypothetical protein [Micromonosporaceae bacterium]
GSPAAAPGSPVAARPPAASSATVGQGARGAAQVPPARPRPDVRHPQPGAPAPAPVRSGNRSIVVVLVLILGLLVLLCAGVISYLAGGLPLGAPSVPSGSSVAIATDGHRVGHDDPAGAPYRRMVRAAAAGAVPTT